SLLLLTVLLIQEDLGVWAFLPGAIGLVGVLASWSAAPPLVLLLLLGVLVARPLILNVPTWLHLPGSPVVDLLLAIAVLVYVGSANRLLSLVRAGVPPDPRHGRRIKHGRVLGRWLLPFTTTARTAERSGKGEVAGLLGAALLAALMGSLLWLR